MVKGEDWELGVRREGRRKESGVWGVLLGLRICRKLGRRAVDIDIVVVLLNGVHGALVLVCSTSNILILRPGCRRVALRLAATAYVQPPTQQHLQFFT